MGHAILKQDDILQPDRYAVSGTNTKNGRMVEASGVLCYFDTDDEAQQAGLDWARALLDVHG
ncbi:hypothetical protein [Paraburkholderia sediminicola]|uniref:hypothetical protein n=1 Tax=Paraburkholderia sediminicola TaxID=458836 RepID=UPI0038B80127